MRKEKGITLVALVVTIIVLIILAGISINLVLGDNGIITIAKKAKENTELAKIQEETELNELYTQLETEGSSSGNLPYDSIAKLTEFKTAIANAIEEAGGVKPEVSAETTVFANNIRGIVKEVTKNATATASDIASGKTAWVNGNLLEGTMKNSNGETILANMKRGTFSSTVNNWYDVSLGYRPDFVYLISSDFSIYMEYNKKVSETQYLCEVKGYNLSEYVDLKKAPSIGLMYFNITDDGFQYLRTWDTALNGFYVAGIL